MTDLPKGNLPNVLKPEHCTTLNKCLQHMADTRELIQACKDCKLPVEEAEEENNRHIEFTVGLKKKFFPLNP